MKVDLDSDLRVSLQLDELLEWLSVEDKLKVADLLACCDDVIKYVGQQITDRWTEHGSNGYRRISLSNSETPLDIVTREVAMKSSLVASRVIKDLREAFHAQRKTIEELRATNLAQLQDLQRLRFTPEAADA